MEQNTEVQQNVSVQEVDELGQKRAQKTLSKRDLMVKAHQVEEPYFERAGGTIPLRRLTSNELAQMEELQSSGVSLSGDQGGGSDGMKMSVNVAKSVNGEALARHRAVALALSVNGETWTTQEVGDLPDGQLVRDIANKVYELSGAAQAQQEAAKSVRQDAGGGADSVAQSPGVSVSE